MIIRFFEIENAEDFRNYEKYLPLISAERRERVKRIKSPKAKTVCLLAEVLMRREIGKALGMSKEDIIFSYTKHGKPYIEKADYHFSISHTENVIVFTDSPVPVGIDIEGVYSGKAPDEEKEKRRLRVAGRFFTEREFESIKKAADFDVEFCRIWTMKEAYVKMQGKGLLTPLNSFDVDNMESEVYYYNIVYKGYSISVCREGAEPGMIEIIDVE